MKVIRTAMDIEDLTRVVILYEIYETSLRNDHKFKILFIISPFQMGLYRLQNEALLTRALSMTLRLIAKVLLHLWSYDFHDMTLSIE